MIHEILAQLDNGVAALQTLLYVDVVQPFFFRFGLMGYDEDTYDALYWVIIGVLEILVMYLALRPLEALRPIETWTDRKALRADVIYTWIGKLGIVNLAFFFILQPLFDHWQSLMAIHNVPNFDIDGLWPGVTDQGPLVSFIIYLTILDFFGYWYHRWQPPVRRVVGTACRASQPAADVVVGRRPQPLSRRHHPGRVFCRDFAVHRRSAHAVRRARRAR